MLQNHREFSWNFEFDQVIMYSEKLRRISYSNTEDRMTMLSEFQLKWS